MSGKRGNDEGSIYPYRNGYAAYVWDTKPDGKRARKYAYGKTREELHEKWLNLHAEAKRGPVATRNPTVGASLSYWLDSVVKPNLAPLLYVSYEGSVRLYIAPHLDSKRFDRLTVRDVREWVIKLSTVCQCCAQGKDAKREPRRRRCCAVGECCEAYPSRRVVQAAAPPDQALVRRGGEPVPHRCPPRVMTTSSRPGSWRSASACVEGKFWG